jgi:hypothetical protein
MSTVCVLTPIVIGSWPMIAAAVAGAASSLGFSVVGEEESTLSTVTGTNSVETAVPNSEIIAEEMAPGQKMRIERAGVAIEFGIDERGACTVCVTGEGRTRAELSAIGEEVAGRVVQQFAYHKLMAELKDRGYGVVDESMHEDDSIQVRVRLGQ